jgi:hypothetical protein
MGHSRTLGGGGIVYNVKILGQLQLRDIIKNCIADTFVNHACYMYIK